MFTIKDLSTALYALSKAKGYALTVILTLGLTLGSLVAMFNLNYQILAAPLPYADEEQLVVGSTAWLDKDGTVMYARMLPVSIFRQYYQQPSEQLSDQALYSFSYIGMTLRDLPHSPQVQIAYTTPGYMRMYQMPLLHGRAFSAEEDLGSQQPVAVLSEKIWREHYNADPELVGRSVHIGNQQFKVVGIAGAEFIEPGLTGPARNNDIWLPWDFSIGSSFGPGDISGAHLYLAKLKDASQRQVFEQELRPQVASQYQDDIAALPSQAGRSLVFNADPLRLVLEGDSRSRTLWMLAGSLLLLLIAAANITNLLLSRAARQQRSMSIQAALGAQRHHLLGQVLAELSWLMSSALLLAFIVAEGAYHLLQLYAGAMLPRLAELGFDWPILTFAVAVSLLLALGFAALISRQINYRALQQNLQSSGKGSGVQISSRTRQVLIGAQVMLAAMLLICSAQVLLQSLQQLRQQVGFSSVDRYQITIDNITATPDESLPPEQRRALYRQQKDELMQVRDILQQHPAVQAVSVSNYPPISFDGYYGSASFIPSPDSPNQQLFSRAVFTDQFYLPLFDIKLLQGRNFTAQEVAAQAQVIIINQVLAQQLKPDGNVLGEMLYSTDGSLTFEIIGVSANHHLPDVWSAEETGRSYLTRNIGTTANLQLQLKPGMQIDKTAINQAMAQVSPHYRAANMHSIEDNVNRVLLSNYLAAAVTTSLVVLSFLLAAIGIYGVLSYSVQLRRFELGVRMAIGARPVTILQQLLGENLKPVLAGLVLAAILLAALWLGLQQTTLIVELSAGGFALPLLLIVLLTVLTSLLSVWGIIRKPAIYALQGR
ncbi:ABC transporter permease [Rheinheimera sp.]|uniref:ABC transporter permease n=1 Tax=Rheinheimera sp. TaxID=1869214 RepID=UPI0027359A8F|nr:ABC transporter permease [Rheinheimera sp.]MDP2716961.1 ABC transporter permease [Rheinheimera sp.]